MSDVEKLFYDWIRELRKNYYLDRNDVVELRDHVIDEVEELINEREITYEVAFQIAISNIGNLGELGREYEKVNNNSFMTFISYIKRNSMKIALSAVIVGLVGVIVLMSMNVSFFPDKGIKYASYNAMIWREIGKDKEGKKLPSGIIFPWQNNKEEEVWGRKEYSMPAKAKYWCYFYTHLVFDKSIKLDKECIYYAVIDENEDVWFDQDGIFNNSTTFPVKNNEEIIKDYSDKEYYNHYKRIDNISTNNTISPFKNGDLVYFDKNDINNIGKGVIYRIYSHKMSNIYGLFMHYIPIQKEQKSIFQYYIDKLKFTKPKNT